MFNNYFLLIQKIVVTLWSGDSFLHLNFERKGSFGFDSRAFHGDR